MLAVLQGSSLGDAAVVVTRFFGGTLLGTGELVRAYSDAVRSVITAIPRGQKVLTSTVMLELELPTGPLQSPSARTSRLHAEEARKHLGRNTTHLGA